jgi:hypothetical protein
MQAMARHPPLATPAAPVNVQALKPDSQTTQAGDEPRNPASATKYSAGAKRITYTDQHHQQRVQTDLRSRCY